MCHIIVCEDAPKTDSDIPCEGTTRVYRLTKEDDYKAIGICTKHAEQRGYLKNPQFSPDTETAKAFLNAHHACADIAQIEDPYGLNRDKNPECTFNTKTRQFGPTDQLYVIYLPESDEHVVLCLEHAHRRGYLGNPRCLPTDEGAKAYTKLQRFLEADRAFVQVYHPELTCVLNSDACAKDGVAEYWFSDGSTLPLCTIHLPNTHALRSSKNGHWMSREYYDQVYNKEE